MKLCDYREKFHSAQMDKHNYIEEMFGRHQHLFEYADFIKQTDISSIEIRDDQLIMTARSSGIKFLCESIDKRMAPIEILNFNSYEKSDSDMIFELIEPDMVVFDIGGNMGWYTLSLAKRYPTLKIHTFEPIPKTFNTLQKNVLLNHLSNVTLYNMGFSNQKQNLTFYFDPLASGNASSQNLTDNAHIQQVVAKVEKLDSFFMNNGLSQLDFIKCDVEGAELLVYQGGIETITQYRPIIFTEMLRKWSAKFNYHPNEIIQLLANLAYRCFTVKNNKLVEFFSMDDHTIETNFFFLHSSKHLTKIQQMSR